MGQKLVACFPPPPPTATERKLSEQMLSPLQLSSGTNNGVIEDHFECDKTATIRVFESEDFSKIKEKIFLAFGGNQLHPELWPNNQELCLQGEWLPRYEKTDRLLK
ncbi:unnamed protein product [Adineta steineri]|uniref:Uncharacterized protein n=1 Tax=Adineta steineri TaxID=433720 RepID=A0A814X203_9BILA|nr:unnamed protein product [Adineta steineri]CAF4039300.1 unnamed protein product [Adineta steineri]